MLKLLTCTSLACDMSPCVNYFLSGQHRKMCFASPAMFAVNRFVHETKVC